MAKILLPALMKAAQVWHCQVGFARELVPRSGFIGSSPALFPLRAGFSSFRAIGAAEKTGITAPSAKELARQTLLQTPAAAGSLSQSAELRSQSSLIPQPKANASANRSPVLNEENTFYYR